VSLLEQMQGVDLLLRRPGALDDLLARLPEQERGVFEGVDRARLSAVNASFVTLLVARWWQARFPATLATLAHALGGRLGAARALVASRAFEGAVGEDLTGSAIVGAVLDADEALPLWLPDLVAYEYLLSTGLPRRARGEPIDAALEARALEEPSWLSGGRLTREVLVASFAWPVGALQEEPHDAEPCPETHLLAIVGDEELVDAEAPDVAVDALSLLAEGADDAVLRAALGEEADAALDWLRELGLLA